MIFQQLPNTTTTTTERVWLRFFNNILQLLVVLKSVTFIIQQLSVATTTERDWLIFQQLSITTAIERVWFFNNIL